LLRAPRGSAFAFSAPRSRRPPAARGRQPEPTEPDPSDATADAAIAAASRSTTLQAKIELLQAQVEALQDSIEGVKARMVKVTPSWKGAPQYDDKDAGFSFKPKGALQFDAGYVGFPNGDELAARRRPQLQQPRLEQPRPPLTDRRRRHAAGRLPLQRRVQLRPGHGRLRGHLHRLRLQEDRR
jgi:hypothetical protein